VSTSNPLPAGVSAREVVADVIIDDLIENEALERANPALLGYADTGNVLQSERQEIAADSSGDITVLSIQDAVNSIQLGSKADPNNPSASIAAIVEGKEAQRERIGTAAIHHTKQSFDVLLWLVWSPTQARYLLCDTASA
jgi:hypothetical protein